MKKHSVLLFFISLLFCVSCQDAEMDSGEGEIDCGSSAKVVKKVRNQEGVLHYNEFLKRHTISVDKPNTYDSQDVGLVCNHQINLDFPGIEEGLSVVFNGKFRESEMASPFPGTTYYELEIQKIEIRE